MIMLKLKVQVQHLHGAAYATSEALCITDRDCVQPSPHPKLAPTDFGQQPCIQTVVCDVHIVLITWRIKYGVVVFMF